MRRLIMTSCGFAAGMLATSLAFAQPGIDMQLDRVIRPDRSNMVQAGLMRRWIAVGKCVVGRDRNTSLAFVRAPIGSDDASEAARRLDPIFATCLAGSGAPGPSSAVLRRAALADALGIALPRA
ncbi:hypothetical protein FPZ24_03695 [Sphingomonas panacisoli]|uniref:UrcA family protein n=1 Tax=Sphingomonas panacisoli TaxID=1813879 RepID=A0A5B8LHR2_9SPHN|nr:hypothetical protein [Sphingomonas panacisoli]QDZ06690.1 hypothetical protein FPZ24_03695 [Sphingomonas panacisoli]